jgi:hypothetical protein
MAVKTILLVGEFINGSELVEDLGCIYPNKDSKEKKHYGIFKCKYCGKHFKTRFAGLLNKKTVSCGCEKTNRFYELITKHGIANTRIYGIWAGMVRRCCNDIQSEVHKSEYIRYYSRGISVCDEWKDDCISFYNWAISNGYDDGLEIDRIDNDGNYEPSNCRWVTRSQNLQNRGLSQKNKTGYKGVSFDKRLKKYATYIKRNNKTVYLGMYKTPQEAALVYNNYVIENKTFHPLNVI